MKYKMVVATVIALGALVISAVGVAASTGATQGSGQIARSDSGICTQDQLRTQDRLTTCEGVCSDAVSTLLGLTQEQIQAQRQEGKSLVQIAADKGISEQQLVETIMAARKAEIQAKVTAGTLAQERANLMLQQMEQNVVRAINRTTVGQPEWAGSGQGFGNGQMRNQGQAACGSSYGEPGLGTGPDNMNKWGQGNR